ncbi:MAG: peroxiredoxin, partial [Myxococcota bacterium]
MVKEGDSAPSFSLPSTAGTDRSLSDFSGKKVVVFFYPKDETPGCTREACGFRDNYDELLKSGAEIV